MITSMGVAVAFGALAGFLFWGGGPDRPGPSLADTCTGQTACALSTGGVGPLAVVFTVGVGHSSGTCGCTTDGACTEKQSCHANYSAVINVGIGKAGNLGNCVAADGGGNVTATCACSGCGCTSGPFTIESCSILDGNCVSCGQTTAFGSLCGASACAEKSCH